MAVPIKFRCRRCDQTSVVCGDWLYRIVIRLFGETCDDCLEKDVAW
jgi:hypothetical protein